MARPASRSEVDQQFTQVAIDVRVRNLARFTSHESPQRVKQEQWLVWSPLPTSLPHSDITNQLFDFVRLHVGQRSIEGASHFQTNSVLAGSVGHSHGLICLILAKNGA